MSWEEFQKAVSMLDNKIASAEQSTFRIGAEGGGWTFFEGTSYQDPFGSFERKIKRESSVLDICGTGSPFRERTDLQKIVGVTLSQPPHSIENPLVIGSIFCKHTWEMVSQIMMQNNIPAFSLATFRPVGGVSSYAYAGDLESTQMQDSYLSAIKTILLEIASRMSPLGEIYFQWDMRIVKHQQEIRKEIERMFQESGIHCHFEYSHGVARMPQGNIHVLENPSYAPDLLY